jgi:Predicted membrane protein (DUF2142)
LLLQRPSSQPCERNDVLGAARLAAPCSQPAFRLSSGSTYPPVIIGNLLGLDFPNTLLLMRFVGLIAFTALTAYAIKLTPTLKWAFVLIAMLPVSIYNRSVLSADGAALTYALVITALSFSAVQRYGRAPKSVVDFTDFDEAGTEPGGNIARFEEAA